MPYDQDGSQSVSRLRRARIGVRMTEAQKAHIRQAAALSGQTLSEYVLASAANAARQAVDEHANIKLTRQAQVVFVQALLDPRSAVPRLQRPAETYLEVTARRTGRDEVR